MSDLTPKKFDLSKNNLKKRVTFIQKQKGKKSLAFLLEKLKRPAFPYYKFEPTLYFLDLFNLETKAINEDILKQILSDLYTLLSIEKYNLTYKITNKVSLNSKEELVAWRPIIIKDNTIHISFVASFNTATRFLDDESNVFLSSLILEIVRFYLSANGIDDIDDYTLHTAVIFTGLYTYLYLVRPFIYEMDNGIISTYKLCNCEWNDTDYISSLCNNKKIS